MLSTSAVLVLALAAFLHTPATWANDALFWSSESEATEVCRKQALAVLQRNFTAQDLAKYMPELTRARRLQQRVEAHLTKNGMSVVEGHTGSFPLKQVGVWQRQPSVRCVVAFIVCARRSPS